MQQSQVRPKSVLSIPPGHCLHETSDESPKPSETPFPHL